MADLDGPDLPRDYDDTTRAFVQVFMARRSMTFEDARPMLAELLTARAGAGASPVAASEVTRDDFDAYVAAASQALSAFDYEVRSALHQETRRRVYALVNTTSDPMTQLATAYAPDELSFVRRVLDAMFETRNSPRMEVMCLTELDAMKLRRPPAPAQQRQDQSSSNQTQTPGSSDKGLRPSEVERVMTSLVEEGWLELSGEGFYSLSAQALLELRGWLAECYNDADAAAAGEWQRVKFCVACRDVVTRGLRCSERDCHLRLHDICQDAFFRSRERTCPACGTAWTGDKYVGERAVTMTEAYRRGRRRGGNGKRKSNLAEEVIRQEEQQDGGQEEADGSGEDD